MAPWNSRFPTWKPSFSRCSIGSTWGTASFLVLSCWLRGSLFFIACIEQNDNELLALETVREPWGDQCHRCVIRIWMFNKNRLPPGENEDVAWKISCWVGTLLLFFFEMAAFLRGRLLLFGGVEILTGLLKSLRFIILWSAWTVTLAMFASWIWSSTSTRLVSLEWFYHSRIQRNPGWW